MKFIGPLSCLMVTVTSLGLVAAGAAQQGAAPATPQTREAVLARGATLYRARCASCHELDRNKIGPMHRGVVGRRSATVAGFSYSPALRNAGITWTPAALDTWLAGPQRMVRGSRMYLVVASPADRAAIIAHLERQR